MRPRSHALVFALAIAAGAPALGLLVSTPSYASVSIAVSWEGLLQESSSVAIATPFESKAVWENGRIYTYTHVHVDRAIAGELAQGAEAWVRTMGGIVGDTGQSVEGEAILGLNQSSLLFLHPGPASTFLVTARGQGQFPMVKATDPTQPAHVVRNGAAGLLMERHDGVGAPERLAGDVLHGLSIDDAARQVTSAWSRTHAR
jgi:hypothetical protein